MQMHRRILEWAMPFYLFLFLDSWREISGHKTR
jgi:hypothetical protein